MLALVQINLHICKLIRTIMKLRTISFISLAIAAIASLSCTKELRAAKGDFITKTLEVGFEDSEPASKTYLVNNAQIRWSSSGTDKIIYVFDQDNKRYDFTSTASSASATRSFSCDTWPTTAKVKMVLWSGKSSANEKSVLNGWTLSGESLAIKTTQSPSMSSSFDATTGIAVMKPGDAKMRSVLGYLRYSIGKFPDGSSAAIKSVTVSADEDMAGKITIDYSGNDPVASLVPGGGVKSIIANTRYANKNGVTYEPGYVYVGMLPGTYHNVKLTITAFAADPTTKDAATIEPFTVSLNNDLVIVRGKFTAVAHNLPNVKPEPAQADPWPNDPTAFDYGLQPGVSRRASYDTEELADYGVASTPSDKRPVNQPVISNNVTYGGPGLTFYGNRMVCEKVNSWSTDYPNVIPANRYISFRINRPGRIKFYGAPWGTTVPTFYLAILKKVNGATSTVLKTLTPTEVADASQTENRTDSNINSDAWAKYWNTITVSEEDIAGIDESATVYLYHSAVQVHYWPFYWTSDESNPVNPSSKKKFLLASDSVCRTNSQSEYPRAGWGQKLADTLGNNAEVMNLAVGGRSTKSFITNGHWAGLLSSCYAGDVVVIQFGVNDSSSNSEKHTELDGSSTETYQGVVVGNFQPNLRRMIADVQAKGATPVLCTTTNSRSFSGSTPNETVPTYNAAIRSVASELGVAFIDVNLYHRQWLQSVGYEGSEPYYVTNKLDATQNDNTHITHEGAKVVAGIIGDHLKALGLWQ